MTFCQGCPIQDGRLTAIYDWNLFWVLARYWIEILTLNFVSWYLKRKTYAFLSKLYNSRWATDCHIWSKPILGHNSVLDWDMNMTKYLRSQQQFHNAHSRSRVKGEGNIRSYSKNLCACYLGNAERLTGGGIPSDALRRMLGPEFSAFHLYINISSQLLKQIRHYLTFNNNNLNKSILWNADRPPPCDHIMYSDRLFSFFKLFPNFAILGLLWICEFHNICCEGFLAQLMSFQLKLSLCDDLLSGVRLSVCPSTLAAQIETVRLTVFIPGL